MRFNVAHESMGSEGCDQKPVLGLLLWCSVGKLDLGRIDRLGSRNDTIQLVNFWPNMELDEYLLEPAGRGWNFLIPEPGQKCISHVFENLTMPVRIGNDILQLKPIHAIQDFFRLFANSLLGLGGCFDVATWRGMPNYDEDFGLTLGYWGVPSGPYLVLPFFGPSSPRDGVGRLADSFMAVHSFFLSFPILAGALVIDTVNARAMTLEEIAAERASALDFYSAVRGAYVQFRRGKLRGSGERGAEDAALDDDLYYFDEEEDDE